MKIIVTPAGTKSYLIELISGNSVLQTKTAKSMTERDNIVWEMADLYNVTDIEVSQAEKDDFKFSTIPSIPVLEEEEADEFFESNKTFVYDRILQAVNEGLQAERDVIRLFELSGTGVYITSNKSDWKSGVQQALEYFLTIEEYQKCAVASDLISKL